MQTIYGKCYNLAGELTEKYQFYAEVKTVSQDVDANISRVSIALKVRRNPKQAYSASAYNLTDSVMVMLRVDGQEVYRTDTADIDTRNGRVWTFTTQNVDVAHNADGTKTIALNASFSGADVSSLDSGIVEENVELTAIPRNSSIVSVADVTLGNACNVKFEPEAADYTFRMRFALGEWSAESALISPKRTGVYTYTGTVIPIEVAQQIDGSNTANMTVTLYTYSDADGTAQIGQESANFLVTVPATNLTMPTVRATLEPVNSMTGFDGVYVQGRSKVKATITAAGKFGAQIAAYQMKVDGKTYDGGEEIVSDFLASNGKVTATLIATDTRGIPGGTKAIISVVAYSKPKILPYPGETDVVAARCDADGNTNEGGNYLRIKAKRQYSRLEGTDGQRNFCSVAYRYMGDGGSYSEWKTILAKDSLGSDLVDTGAMLGMLDSKTAYTVQIRAADDMGESTVITIPVPAETVYAHRAKNSLGLGKMVEEENLLDVAWNAQFRGEVKIGEQTLQEYILQIMSEGA